MTLLTAAIAAVIVTLVWYFKDANRNLKSYVLGRHTDVAGRCGS